VLVRQLGATRVSVGENFRFGHRARGDAALLRAQDAFETRVVELVELDGEVVSSTHIRGLVEGGLTERANTFLGSPFQLRGNVAHGDKRGRSLGFPTANIVPDPALVYPGHGVYACRAAVDLDGEWRWWPAATSVGVRPTFVTGRGLLVEAYLLGFDDDLYGRELRLAFLSRLRGEQRFESVDELIEQMHRDVEDTRRIAA
jgi:riboflavin kinase / FMN adenylyltransferase